MKNQYFGDVGDYGKYGLLRFIAKRGVTIAVNWYLTPDDQSNDGHIRGYLTIDKRRIRKYLAHVPREQMDEIGENIRISLHLDEDTEFPEAVEAP